MKSDAVVICGEDDLLCPICAEEMDEGDTSMFPCPCDYQICLWCLKRIRDLENNRCPLCRREYEESNMRKVSPKKIVRLKREPLPKQPEIVESGKNPTVCRLYNCPQSLLSAMVLADFKYMGKYGKLLSVTLIPYRNVETAFLIYAEETDAQLAHADITKLVQKTTQANLKSMRLHVGAARHCIHALRGLPCPNDHCPFTHGHVNKNLKTFWRRKPNQPVIQLSVNIAQLINDQMVDSLFGKNENEICSNPQKDVVPITHVLTTGDATFPAIDTVRKEERKAVKRKAATAIFIPPPPSLCCSDATTATSNKKPGKLVMPEDEVPIAAPPGFADGPPGYMDTIRRKNALPDGGVVCERRSFPPGLDDDVFQRARRLIESGLDMMGATDVFGWDAYDPEKGRGSRWLDGVLNMHFEYQDSYRVDRNFHSNCTPNSSFVSSTDFDWALPAQSGRGDIVTQLLSRGDEIRWTEYQRPNRIQQQQQFANGGGSSMVPGLTAKHPGIEHYNSTVERSGVDLLRSVIPNAKISFVEPKQHIR